MADQTEGNGNVYVKTFFSPDDHARIVEQANAEGRAVANWLRHVALAQLSTTNRPAVGAGTLGAS